MGEEQAEHIKNIYTCNSYKVHIKLSWKIHGLWALSYGKFSFKYSVFFKCHNLIFYLKGPWNHISQWIPTQTMFAIFDL